MAAACAEYILADQLIYLTDVAGVLDGERVLSAIHCEEIGHLIENHTVSGGMVLKLEAAKRALEGGVKGVHIVGGTEPGALLAAMRAAARSAQASHSAMPGTRVLREPYSAALSAV
jgi:acetylglutamate kinase